MYLGPANVSLLLFRFPLSLPTALDPSICPAVSDAASASGRARLRPRVSRRNIFEITEGQCYIDYTFI